MEVALLLVISAGLVGMAFIEEVSPAQIRDFFSPSERFVIGVRALGWLGRSLLGLVEPISILPLLIVAPLLPRIIFAASYFVVTGALLLLRGLLAPLHWFSVRFLMRTTEDEPEKVAPATLLGVSAALVLAAGKLVEEIAGYF